MLEGIERAKAQGHRMALVELLRVRGMVLTGRRSWDEAERTFQEAVSVARSIRYQYAEARVFYEWGLMCDARPDSEQGLALLGEASEFFRRLGARPYLDLAQEAKGGTGQIPK